MPYVGYQHTKRDLFEMKDIICNTLANLILSTGTESVWPVRNTSWRSLYMTQSTTDPKM